MSMSVDDRCQIEDLFARYMWSIDMGDVDALVSCFAPDGSLESPAVGEYAGHENIRNFAARFARFRQNGSQLRHMISNLLIDGDAERASAKCHLCVYLTRDGASRLLGPGQYTCLLRKHGGRWVFEKRTVVMDHEYELEGI